MDMGILRQTAWLLAQLRLITLPPLYLHDDESVLRLHDSSLHNLFQMVGVWLSISVFCGRAHRGLVCGILLFCFQIGIESFGSSHHSGFDYICFTVMFHR